MVYGFTVEDKGEGEEGKELSQQKSHGRKENW